LNHISCLNKLTIASMDSLLHSPILGEIGKCLKIREFPHLVSRRD